MKYGAAAGVDDDGSGDEGNLQPTLPGVPHHRGDAADAGFDAPLGGDLVGHEAEVGARRGRGTPA